ASTRPAAGSPAPRLRRCSTPCGRCWVIACATGARRSPTTGTRPGAPAATSSAWTCTARPGCRARAAAPSCAPACWTAGPPPGARPANPGDPARVTALSLRSAGTAVDLAGAGLVAGQHDELVDVDVARPGGDPAHA